MATTPGAGFGPSGEGNVRLTAFGDAAATVEAVERVKAAVRSDPFPGPGARGIFSCPEGAFPLERQRTTSPFIPLMKAKGINHNFKWVVS